MSSTPTEPAPKPRRKPAPKSEAAPTPEAMDRRRTRRWLRRPSGPEPEAAQTAEIPVDAAPAPTGDLTNDERAELVRLRAQVAATQGLPQGVATAAAPTARPHRARWAGAIVLLLVAALLAPLSALATFTRSTLLDTDNYLAMVQPLASDPAVQEEISRRITDAVFEQLKVKELTTQTLDAIAARPRVEGVTENLPVELSTFAEPISNAIYGFTEGQVSNLVASSTFQDAWVAANREAHASLVSALTGENTGAGVSVSNGQVSVNLAAFIAAIKPVLVEKGVPFADRIPAVERPVRRAAERQPRQGPDGGPAARPLAAGAAGARDPRAGRGCGARPGPPSGARHRRLDGRRHARAAAARHPGAARALPRRPRAGAARAAGGDRAVRHGDHAAAARGALDRGAVPRHRPRRVDRRALERRASRCGRCRADCPG